MRDAATSALRSAIPASANAQRCNALRRGAPKMTYGRLP